MGTLRPTEVPLRVVEELWENNARKALVRVMRRSFQPGETLLNPKVNHASRRSRGVVAVQRLRLFRRSGHRVSVLDCGSLLPFGAAQKTSAAPEIRQPIAPTQQRLKAGAFQTTTRGKIVPLAERHTDGFERSSQESKPGAGRSQ